MREEVRSVRMPMLIAAVFLSLAVWAVAAPVASVRYTLTFYKPVRIITGADFIASPRVSGTIGGVEVAGEYNGERWYVTSTVSPATDFASGPCRCSGYTCTFIITDLLGDSVNIPGSFVAARPASGPLPGFVRRGAWISAVTRWADDHHLKPDVKAKILSQAATEESKIAH
jgi:hypothetical protein